MKKVLCLLFTMLMLLSICACADDQTTTEAPIEVPTVEPTEKDDKIYLTLDNYDTYLNVSARIYPKTLDYYHNYYADRYGTQLIGFEALDAKLSTSGKTDNFNYYDITVTAKVTFTYAVGKTIEHTVTLEDIEITGSGSVQDAVYRGNRIDVDEYFEEKSTFEIISITGYVEPA